MLYQNLKFPKIKGRPFFYTNFVQTLDGKVAVKGEPDYWPIGSEIDYQVLLELRAYADALIHGKNLAGEFGAITAGTLQKNDFKKLRDSLGKSLILPYYVVTHDRTVTHRMYNSTNLNLTSLAKDLHKKGYQNILVEGGPTLLASFLKENLLDEIFLTIAPKIYGSKPGKTLTLVEGCLFPKKAIKKLTLLSFKKMGNELFLRYKVENKI